MPEVETVPELRDVAVTVERIPRTALVHVEIAGAGGLVLTRAQAIAISRELQRVAGRARRTVRPRARERAAAG